MSNQRKLIKIMLSAQIVKLRTQKKLSQAQLAKELCISPSALGMYEQGRRVPCLDILMMLSNYFHVSLDYLITGSEFSHPEPQETCRVPEECPCSTCFWKECKR